MVKFKKKNIFPINKGINKRGNLLPNAIKHIKEKIKNLLLNNECIIKKAIKSSNKKEMEKSKTVIIITTWKKIKLRVSTVTGKTLGTNTPI